MKPQVAVPALRGANGKTDLAYALLRGKILGMELAPGTFLNERDMMQTLGVGRTPLREAILRLAQQRMVSLGAHRTPQVAPIAVSDLTTIPETRRILEIPAARLAAIRATAAERRSLVETNDLFRERAEHGAWRDMIEIDDRIHKLIAGASHNVHLADAVSQLNGQSYRLWVLGAIGSEVVGKLDPDTHTDIVEAIARGDADGAEHFMTVHVDQFTARVQRIAAGGALHQQLVSALGG